jgi:hypothetical protein
VLLEKISGGDLHQKGSPGMKTNLQLMQEALCGTESSPETPEAAFKGQVQAAHSCNNTNKGDSTGNQ